MSDLAVKKNSLVGQVVEDLSYEEMEQLTGAGVSALKMRVKRACDRLRDLLKETHELYR